MGKKNIFIILIAFSGVARSEIINIPKKSGFSGFVTAGVSSGKYSSNLFKGPSKENIKNNGLMSSPEPHSFFLPIYSIDARYTFADTGSQVFLGNLIQDSIRFDFTQQFGIRQKIDDYGIFSIGYVFSLSPSKTWKDPYTQKEKKDTKMKSNGFRISLDNFYNTYLNIAYTSRNYKLDEEESGRTLGLSQHDTDLLNRRGKSNEIELSYNFLISKNHVLQPRVSYSRYNLDGKAMSYDKTNFQFTYGYTGNQWSIASNVFSGFLNYNEKNPVYRKLADSNEYGLNSTILFNNISNISDLTYFLSLSYSKLSSEINFYDSEIKSINTGLIYHF
ncbi:TPA: DUF2860 family protein [Klebsiella variicola]|uniref:DUF2860 family protein n=1 Tax=Klebsiella quasipneumoniae TaxID=1463165 RepID=UPI002B0A867C|nr:DUF2860 family protein [Klebsiella variicola]